MDDNFLDDVEYVGKIHMYHDWELMEYKDSKYYPSIIIHCKECNLTKSMMWPHRESKESIMRTLREHIDKTK